MIGLLCNLLNLTNFQIIPLYYTYQIYCCHVKYVNKDLEDPKSPTASTNLVNKGENFGISSGSTVSKKSFLERRFSNPLFGYDTSASSAIEQVGITPNMILVKYFMCYVHLGVMNTEKSFWSGRENGEKSIVLYLNSVICNPSQTDPAVSGAAQITKFDKNFNINTQLHHVLKYWMMVVAYTALIKPVISFIGLGFFTNRYFESLVGVSFAISLFGNLFVKDYHSNNFLNDSFELLVHRLFTFYELLNWTVNYMQQRVFQNIDYKTWSNHKDGNSNPLVSSQPKREDKDAGRGMLYTYYTYVYDKGWEYLSSRLQVNALTQEQQAPQDEATASKEQRSSLELIQDYDIVDDFAN
ncbi:hypothetical protein ACO0RG_004004 [Hanseniaspora osmophila]